MYRRVAAVKADVSGERYTLPRSNGIRNDMNVVNQVYVQR